MGSMARFTAGWVKLHRSPEYDDLTNNIHLWALWTWLLKSATWKPTIIAWNGRRRDLAPGSVVIGIKELADQWSCSRATIKKWLEYLQKSERISLEVTSKGTLIIIRNWLEFQAKEIIDTPAEDAGCDNDMTSEWHQGDNEVTLSKEFKKERINTSAAEAATPVGEQKSKPRAVRAVRAAEPTEGSQLWSYYKQQLEAKNKPTVAPGAKERAWCKSLCSEFGLTKAKLLIDAYVADNDPFVSGNGWSLNLLISQRQKYLCRIDDAGKPQLDTSWVVNELELA